jgi:hypothetical protein
MEVGVEQALKNFFGCRTNIDRSVIPGFDNQVHSIDQNNLGDISSRFVEYKIEVILAQKRMCGVGCQCIIKNLVLVNIVNDFSRC